MDTQAEMSKRWVTFELEAGLWMNQHIVMGEMGFCLSPPSRGTHRPTPI